MSMAGKKHTEEWRKKQSERNCGENNPNFGKHHSKEVREKISKKARERFADPNFHKSFSENQKKILNNPVTKKKMSESQRRKKPAALGTRIKMSIAHKGKKHPPRSEESLKRMSVAQTGKKRSPFSEETKKRMSESAKKKPPFSEEHCKRIRDSRRGKGCKEENGNWRGGTSFFPYCPKFNNRFKDNVRGTYGGKCQFPNCGKTMEEIGKGRKHHVHHVFVEKMACCEGNIKDMDLVRKRLPKIVAKFGEPSFTEEEVMYIRMVVPLCHSHHSVVSHESYDLVYEDTVYRKYFAELIMNEYGGRCWSKEKDEITAIAISEEVYA